MDTNPSWTKLRKYKIPMELWSDEALDGYRAFTNPQRVYRHYSARVTNRVDRPAGPGLNRYWRSK